MNADRPFDVFELPEKGEPEPYTDMFRKHAVRFLKGRKSIAVIETKNACQKSLICLIGKTGYRGLVRVPHEEEECKGVLKPYEEFIEKRNKRLRELIDERTADEDMQEKILESLLPLLRK